MFTRISNLLSLIILLIGVSHLNCSKPPENQGPVGNSMLPTLTTSATTNITPNSANSGGILVNDGGSPVTEKGVCFATSTAPTTASTKIIATGSATNFSVILNGLTANTTYYIRAYAINAVGTAYGNEVSFRTSTTPYVVTDPAATMYVSGGYTNKLFALNASDGSIKWSVTLGDFVMTSPIYSNGFVYVGCKDDKLYAYDTVGNLKWTASVDAFFHECPVVANGIVYYPEQNSVSAFNAISGALIWKMNGPGANIVVKDNVVYSNNNHLYAINALTGAQIWKYRTDDDAQPLVFDDRIYVLNQINSDSLCVINRATGSLIWGKRDYGLFNDVVGMNIKHGNIYCVNDVFNVNFNTNGLNVLDSATGIVKFPRMPFTVSESYSDEVLPLFADSVAFVTADYVIYVYNAFDGQYLYSVPGQPTNSGMTIANDLLYFTQRSTFIMNPNTGGGYYAGFVHAFDYKTRTMRWSKEFRDVDFIWAAPCIVTQSGKVFRGGLMQ